MTKVLISLLLFAVIALSNGQTFEELNCNYICPDNYEPVCGYNGEDYEEFATECDLKNANCLLGRDKTKGWLICQFFFMFYDMIFPYSIQTC